MLHFIGITLPAFGGYRMRFPELFGAPLAISSIILALWLIAKGFVNVPVREDELAGPGLAHP